MAPIQLADPAAHARIVYSPHVYGPSVYMQVGGFISATGRVVLSGVCLRVCSITIACLDPRTDLVPAFDLISNTNTCIHQPKPISQ